MSIEEIVARLRAGEIVALKGLGGFHLACDASVDATVNRLRALKQRNGKPFALMVANLASARRIAEISDAEATLMSGTERPIVLVQAIPGEVPAAVAPDLAHTGIMLPYTPLHYLLFHEAAGRPAGMAWLDQPQDLTLVMTSANPLGEPLAITNQEAEERLAGIADCIVTHDRDILIRSDDSVARVIAGTPTLQLSLLVDQEFGGLSFPVAGLGDGLMDPTPERPGENEVEAEAGAQLEAGDEAADLGHAEGNWANAPDPPPPFGRRVRPASPPGRRAPASPG